MSDDAVSSHSRDVRRILGNESKGLIRTIRGRGFRFDAKVSLRSAAQPAAQERAPGHTAERASRFTDEDRASIAVLPFQRNRHQDGFTAIEQAIPRELIAALASLRWVRVVSHGSMFQFRGTDVSLADIRRILKVRYCLTGIVEVIGRTITMDTEMSDTRSAEVIWALRKSADIDDVQALRAEIAANVIMVAELEISQHQASMTEVSPTENLHTWSALHLGFRQMSLVPASNARFHRLVSDTVGSLAISV